MIKATLPSLLVAACLSACATSSDLKVPATNTIASEELPENWQAAQSLSHETPNAWIASFQDRALEALMVEALDNNPGLRSLEADLKRARALTRQSAAALKPQLSFNAGVSEQGDFADDNGSNIQLGGVASWEIDLWGRLDAARRAANLNREATAQDLAGARLILAASVAEAYFSAIEAKLQTQEAGTTFEALSKNLAFIEVQYERGLRSGQDIALIRADVARSNSRLIATQNAERDSLRALEILIGRYPSTDLDIPSTLPNTPKPQSAGVPAQLLERRPDLIAARARIEAAVANVDVAIAERMPRLSLSGDITPGGARLDTLFDPASILWRAAGSMFGPVLDGGRRRAVVEAEQASLEGRLADYRETALAAFGEVEQLLDRQGALDAQITQTERAFEQARQALQFTTFQFENGEGDLLDVLSIQQRVSSLESTLISLKRARLALHAQLSLALGGQP